MDSVQAEPDPSWLGSRALTLRYLDPVSGAPRWASIDLASSADRAELVALIASFLTEERLREDVVITPPKAVPALEFLAPGGGVLARLGEAAAAGGALHSCIRDALARPESGEWRLQGRSARARLAEAPAITGMNGRWAVGAELTRVALVAAVSAGQDPLMVPVRLRVEGRLLLADNGVSARDAALRWESEAYPLAQWIDAGADARTPSELRAACAAVAALIVRTARDRWRD
ncbi:MAG: hypothetical protein KGQ67_08410 [Betaproteobacteria bacterium]|nr:hypothetical protein [Betaproteobacteria bacterium]